MQSFQYFLLLSTIVSVISIGLASHGIKTRRVYSDRQYTEPLNDFQYPSAQFESKSSYLQDPPRTYSQATDTGNIANYYVECPPGASGPLAYKYDCTKFLNCWNGKGTVQPCAPGTAFNAEISVCDNPRNVMCLNFEDAQPSRTARFQAEAANTNEVACLPGRGTLQPHPSDCTRFLNCGSGRMFIQQCGPGTAFSPTAMVCDFLNKVDCSGRQGTLVVQAEAVSGESYGVRGAPLPPPSEYGTFEGETTTRQNSRAPKAYIKSGNNNNFGEYGHHHNHMHHSSNGRPHDHSMEPNHNNNYHHHHHNHRHHNHPSNGSPVQDRWTQMNVKRPEAPTYGAPPREFEGPNLPNTNTFDNGQHPLPESPTWNGQQPPNSWNTVGSTTTSRTGPPYPPLSPTWNSLPSYNTQPNRPHPPPSTYPVAEDLDQSGLFSPTNYNDPSNRHQPESSLWNVKEQPTGNRNPPKNTYEVDEETDDKSNVPQAVQPPQSTWTVPHYNTPQQPAWSASSSDRVRPTTRTHVVEGTVHVVPPSDGSPFADPTWSHTTNTVYYAQPVGEDEDSEEIIQTVDDNQPESNFFGGLQPPYDPSEFPSTTPMPASERENRFIPFPEQPTRPMRPEQKGYYPLPSAELKPPMEGTSAQQPVRIPIGTKTNVRVYQVYPPNATVKVSPDPIISPPYSSVAHYMNTTWDTPTPTRKTKVSTITSIPQTFPTPEIIYSRDEGVVLTSDPEYIPSYIQSTPRQPSAPPGYNREYYQTTKSTTVPSDGDKSDELQSNLQISEALKMLLRPYINPDKVDDKEDSHVMSLVRTPKTSTGATTTTTTPDPDVEIIFGGEQSSLTERTFYNHPPHHLASGHSEKFHREHPNLPTPQSYSKGSTTTPPIRVKGLPSLSHRTSLESEEEAEACEFDCGDGRKCIKMFEVCDGINNCGNRLDESACEYLGYEVRLNGDPENSHMGRVEVKILGKWGHVCDHKFDKRDADVLCKELGFSMGASEVRAGSFYKPNRQFSSNSSDVPFAMDEIDCRGDEKSLRDCDFRGWGVSDCTADEVVGVACEIPVMRCPKKDFWMCNESKQCIPPAYVCDNTPDCEDGSDESDAVCRSPVEYRLADGEDKYEGRVEVKFRGEWGTVCDDDFGDSEAEVICRSLGFEGPALVLNNTFGAGSGIIWLDQVACFGNETSISQCIHNSWGDNNCNHIEDISIRCLSSDSEASQSSRIAKSTKLLPLQKIERSSGARCGQITLGLSDEFAHPEDVLARVVKGNVARRGHHPWQASIRVRAKGNKSTHWCGAVLISKKHLLTAAHCLVEYTKGAFFIRLGDNYSNIDESTEVDAFIENWFIHEKFRDGQRMNNDIALIVLKSPVRFNDFVQPICLPEKETDYREGKLCQISGWGSTDLGSTAHSNSLRFARIPIIADNICKKPYIYGNNVTEGMFCAGYLNGSVDACDGDSGGPMTCSDENAETLYGIISWGYRCGDANKPGVYVRVSKYLDWINQKMAIAP